MAKKLAVFCDGTWNDLRKDIPTNVVRLAKCVAPTSESGDRQIVYYDSGVGVAANIGWVVDKATKYVGGALGRGLDQKIEDAYRFLVLNFEPDDEIYVFGFSRGAYTARSLCGLIRKCGILRRSCFNLVPQALQRYRDKVHPSSPEMVQFRTSYAHPLATGTEDHERFGVDERNPGTLLAGERRAAIYQYRPPQTYRMMFVGIWDTVGALGVPNRYDWLHLNRRYKFHDTNASSLLASIRHAVAANEQRGLYDVTPFDNLDKLNIEWAGKTGWNVTDRGHASFVPFPDRPYQQRWFPGDHCSVGGGYAEIGLSSDPLLWLAQGAEWAGLSFTDDPTNELGVARRAISPFAPLGDKGRATMPAGKSRAAGPSNVDDVSDSLYQRWDGAAEYRPPNLHVLRGAPMPRPAPPPLPPGFPPR
jgi:uncharacterized protein (DUF2235 family)